ncbi:hypothetical protein A2661_02825 [Candidatus Giovannonibacteria bacterium RIFCSPHIGHO2_01_FULL_45_24]|nr:MAG: hypothetical protein A2661_02825 [Candidatus Giovannonibacteria bacterium RIFCSPHIGHO2_01_FULL_45_24]
MAKKAQIEPAQNCEEILNIDGVIFTCDDPKRGHTAPHCSQRKIKVGGLNYHIVYIITWRKAANVVLSSQN